MFKVTLKTLRARKFRLISTGFAVVLGIGFLAGTLVLTSTISSTFDSLFADAFKGVDAAVRGEKVFEGDATQGQEDARSPVPVSAVATVAAVDGVAVASGYIETNYAQLVGADGEPVGSQNSGTYGANWLGDTPLNSYTLDAGRGPEADDEIVLDRGGARDGGVGVGDQVTVLNALGSETYTVVGIAAFGDEDTAGGRHYIFFTDEQARVLANQPDAYDSILAAADDGVSQSELRDRIAEVVPSGTEVITGAELTEESQSEIKNALSIFNTFLVVFAVIALLVGSFIIYNTFSILVAQRTRELALLRALGASRGQVRSSVLLEALVVGIVASAVGIVAGVGLSILLKAALSGFGLDLPASGVVLTSDTVVTCMIAGVVVCLASALFPARRASKVPPVAAMSGLLVEDSASSPGRIVAGVLVLLFGAWNLFLGLSGRAGDGSLGAVGLGAAIVFIGVAMLGPVFARPISAFIGWPLPRLRGISGTLARENAMRNPRRTSTTASALMIGVGLVILITILVSSLKASINTTIDNTFKADFTITTDSFTGGLSPDLTRQLNELPEVAAATGIRAVSAQVDEQGGGRSLYAVDPVAFQEVWSLDVTSGSLDDLGTNGVAIDSNLGSDKDLAVGDTLTLTFAETGTQTFTVEAIFDSDSGLFTQYLISLESVETYTSNVLDAQIVVKSADGVPAADARAAIESVTDAYPTADVLDQADYKESLAAQLNQLLALVIVLLLLAVIIALFGIANTLSLSIHERTRELGLLRAVGMTRAQLRSTVRWESVIISMLGVFLGLIIGLIFGWLAVLALEDQGLSDFRVPFGQLALVVVLGAVAGVAAAILPARRASRLDVLDAIAAD